MVRTRAGGFPREREGELRRSVRRPDGTDTNRRVSQRAGGKCSLECSAPRRYGHELAGFLQSGRERFSGVFDSPTVRTATAVFVRAGRACFLSPWPVFCIYLFHRSRRNFFTSTIYRRGVESGRDAILRASIESLMMTRERCICRAGSRGAVLVSRLEKGPGVLP